MADRSALLLGRLDREADHRRGGCTVAAHGGALTWQGHAALLTQSLDNPAGLTTCPHQSHDYDDESEPPFYTLDGTQTAEWRPDHDRLPLRGPLKRCVRRWLGGFGSV